MRPTFFFSPSLLGPSSVTDEIYIMAVYRVNWLRAKARCARWYEEERTVKTEMGNTLRYYRRRAYDWDKRADKSDSQGHAGHACYARRKSSMWKALGAEAEKLFKNNPI